MCVLNRISFSPLYLFAGKGWGNHIDGQKLKADGDSFRLKLNTQEIFEEWARKVQTRNLGVTGRIFAIESTRSRTGRGNVLRLKVNFLPEIITLSKEVCISLTHVSFPISNKHSLFITYLLSGAQP